MNIAEKIIPERLSKKTILTQFKKVRDFTHYLVEPLETEDFVIQPMESASPAKWHLAHTSWFFETFVLGKFQPDFESLHPQYAYFFNSYYLQTGVPFTRAKRGLLSRPTVKEVFEYRAYVNEQMESFINNSNEGIWSEVASVIEIGNHHEQQHQELILTDLKFLLAQNPLLPVYREAEPVKSKPANPINWISFEEGLIEVGNKGNEFTYDNEHPHHRTFVQDFELADRLVTNDEYLEFMNSGGYEESRYWLDEGWSAVQREGWKAPLYWFKREGKWMQFTLSGVRPVDSGEPVTHISYYEADAYARWKGCRLPTEQEWEHACGNLEIEGNFVDEDHFHPVAVSSKKGLKQMFGDTWEWTMSSYSPYPNYKPLPGALGEYNGKFMANQYVLRGGSCATSQSHIRKTYRNFFHADARWQFSGIRLAR
ncbi:MAG: ergothioneine biosynthesis protein EgtB [Balneolaceae bacterium]|nr:ergothioneine biosynthesis protein EgtB [Balneolaceae bacterium]MBO6545211.1 ergothioneine biosynthesis protein EgtB [Balneolaceae bacterium]MBO6646607.1 ergothioneine biosynthesis protein EgtB [Balneolaceae bacterium]